MTPLLSVLFYVMTLAGSSVIDSWVLFETAVRDQTIAKDEAQARFSALFPRLAQFALQFRFSQRDRWIFPVASLNIRDVGRGGFKPDSFYGSSPIKGYDFYDGNNHGGHPAYDIFVHDSDQDCLDDKTRGVIQVLAPLDLLILSINTGWNPASNLRGGNYVWAYYGPSAMLFYFAHLDSVQAAPGEFRPAGSPLGCVGRTGLNANPKRSPTHLHFMVLRVEGSRLTPVDTWASLRSALPKAP